MIVVAWMVTRRMVRPILSMTATAAEIAGGDWKRRIPEDRIDELGELARAFNQMVDQLETMYRSVAEERSTSSRLPLPTCTPRTSGFQDIIEFLPDATFVVDADNKVIAWNRALEEMTGVSKAEMLGKGDLAYAIPFYGERRPILIDRLDTRCAGSMRRLMTAWSAAKRRCWPRSIFPLYIKARARRLDSGLSAVGQGRKALRGDRISA